MYVYKFAHFIMLQRRSNLGKCGECNALTDLKNSSLLFTDNRNYRFKISHPHEWKTNITRFENLKVDLYHYRFNKQHTKLHPLFLTN